VSRELSPLIVSEPEARQSQGPRATEEHRFKGDCHAAAVADIVGNRMRAVNGSFQPGRITKP
jgi:hypothetical protein